MEKTPCIECTSRLWEYIKPYLEKWGYFTDYGNIVGRLEGRFNLLVINWGDNLGYYGFGIKETHLYGTRELTPNPEEFLERAAKLKGFTYNRKDKKMEKEFTKADLELGMIVEMEDGERALYTIINKIPIFLSLKTQIRVEGYNEDLSSSGSSCFNIVKVFKVGVISNFMGLSDKNNQYLELIWERKEPKEYTMQEIADKLGIPVEELRIKKD